MQLMEQNAEVGNWIEIFSVMIYSMNELYSFSSKQKEVSMARSILM